MLATAMRMRRRGDVRVVWGLQDHQLAGWPSQPCGASRGWRPQALLLQAGCHSQTTLLQSQENLEVLNKVVSLQAGRQSQGKAGHKGGVLHAIQGSQPHEEGHRRSGWQLLWHFGRQDPL